MHVKLSACHGNKFLLQFQRHSLLKTWSAVHFRLYVQFYSRTILSPALRVTLLFSFFVSVDVLFVFLFSVLKVRNYFVIFISVSPKLIAKEYARDI